jgi:hypothetical protein
MHTTHSIRTLSPLNLSLNLLFLSLFLVIEYSNNALLLDEIYHFTRFDLLIPFALCCALKAWFLIKLCLPNGPCDALDAATKNSMMAWIYIGLIVCMSGLTDWLGHSQVEANGWTFVILGTMVLLLLKGQWITSGLQAALSSQQLVWLYKCVGCIALGCLQPHLYLTQAYHWLLKTGAL